MEKTARILGKRENVGNGTGNKTERGHFYAYCMSCTLYSASHLLFMVLLAIVCKCAGSWYTHLFFVQECIISCVGTVDSSRFLLGDANGRLLMLFIETEQVCICLEVYVGVL